ncbi:MAG: hypothetical protein GY765_06885, partial [bacterium]|nr:hypothetical protein [bacterium]
VVIENVSIDNTNQPLGTTCEAPPGKGNLEIKYTGLSFLLPNKVLFKYKLEGFDDDWVNVGTRRTAYYTNIPPGDYKFSVIACNNDGLWNYQGDSFRFTLKPHFYQQKIFYFALPALALLIAMAFYRLRVHNLKTREKRLQKMVEERTAELNRKNEQLKTEIGQRSKAEKEKEKLIDELRDALAKIKTLTGLIPICSKCKKIRDDKGYWQQVDVYIVKHSEVDFSHSLCPDCLDYLYPNISERMKKAMKEE